MKYILLVLIVIGFSSCENAQEQKEIETYHQYRIGESAKYHNYDTTYASARQDYYENKKPCPTWYNADGNRQYAGWEQHDNSPLYIIIPSLALVAIGVGYFLRNRV